MRIIRSQWFLMPKAITEKQVPSHTEAGLCGRHWSITGLRVLLTEHWDDRDCITMVLEKVTAECVPCKYLMLQLKYLSFWILKANCDAHYPDGALPNAALGLSPNKAHAQALWK